MIFNENFVVEEVSDEGVYIFEIKYNFILID